jgi:hypothetical protein
MGDPLETFPNGRSTASNFEVIKKSADAPLDRAMPVSRAPQARFRANGRTAAGTFELRRQSHAPQ